MPLPKTMKASSRPSPGPGLASSRNRTDLPFSDASVGAERGQHTVVDGVVEEEDLGRLDEHRGERQQVVVDQGLDAVAERLDHLVHDGADAEEAEDGRGRPQMPAENLLTSISKPGLILPSHSASSCFITQPRAGP